MSDSEQRVHRRPEREQPDRDRAGGPDAQPSAQSSAQSSAQPNAHEDRRLVRIAAPPDQVWNAWGEPEIIAQWFADRASGAAIPGQTISHFFDKFGIAVEYRVIDAVPGKRLLLEGRSPFGFVFRQQVFVRSDGNETVLELVHSGFGNDANWDEEYQGIDSGWQLALAILTHYLENYYGRTRSNYFVMRPANFEYADLDRWFRTAEGLSQWLTSSGSVPEIGAPYALERNDGSRMSGRVLAWSGREAALSWREVDGVLELKAFNTGPGQRAVALRGCSWAIGNRPPVVDTEAWMENALARLAAAVNQP